MDEGLGNSPALVLFCGYFGFPTQASDMTRISAKDHWQFWMDAGGTFTDCIAIPPKAMQPQTNGPSNSPVTLLRRKVISSAVVKGRVAQVSNPSSLRLEGTEEYPKDFWRGYQARLLRPDGSLLHSAQILTSRCEAGQLQITLSEPISDGDRTTAANGAVIELVSSEEAPLLAIRLFMGLPLSVAIPSCELRLGTTRGTNALLTRRGAKTAWVTTEGFEDLPHIAYQNRPHLFERSIRKPQPLHEAAMEVRERILADGTIEKPLDESHAREQLQKLKRQSVECLAIALLHAAVCPLHELRLAEIAKEVGFRFVSLSHQVSRLRKLVLRGQTTLVDAYLNPVLQEYAQQLVDALPGSNIRLMTSAGGLLRPESFSGKDSVLSGPAGGILGFAEGATSLGFSRAIGFDMGGTSTDVARFDGQLAYQFETEKAGVKLAVPTLAIETIAAGGGSVCHFDGVKLVVGPQSAGADPGPACYGRGGPLTVTDVNLYLGKLIPEHFPFPLDYQAVEQRLQTLSQEVKQATGESMELIKLAQGLDQIASGNMAAAIRQISVAQGYDPREYLLVPFGAAAQQHACAVAEELGVTKILCHPDAGILSARGMGIAPVVRHAEQGIYQPLASLTDSSLVSRQAELQAELTKQLLAEGVAKEEIEFTTEVELRYQGVDAGLRVAYQSLKQAAQAFEKLHQQRFGYLHTSKALEVVMLRVEGRSHSFLQESKTIGTQQNFTGQKDFDAKGCETRPLWVRGELQTAAVVQRSALQVGDRLVGPVLVVDPLSTLVLHPGWKAFALPDGELLLEHVTQTKVAAEAVSSPTVDPIVLEVMHNHFTSIATQMGLTLQSTASSINVKERLDFSCAIFTSSGDLVVNAPHIPVHLGAMGESVRAVLQKYPKMQPGDVFITNDPFQGGSHLPDVTVITPVFVTSGSSEGGAKLSFFTACRAHHAEIGGITPGSMPPFSTKLSEEGVLLSNLPLIVQGASHLEELRQRLQNARFPSRAVADNLADVEAQIAANQKGASDLLLLTERYGLSAVEQAMQSLLAATARKMRRALSQIPDGVYAFADALDDGAPIKVQVTIERDSATIDFTGSAPTQHNNLNANRSIVKAAVTYVLRLLVNQPVPLCEGILEPISLCIPAGILSPQADSQAGELPAVVGGNVETSQRVVDVLLGALGLAAASQGTMNNLLFGDSTFGYYETIGGGEGGSPCGPGASAVHTHMTNTRLTDPEVFETRFPVLLRKFAIRRNSGGAGRFPGGDGILRQIEFRRPLTLSLLTQRRGPFPPFGLAGGEPGKLGQQSLQAGHTHTTLPAKVQLQVSAGDILTIETPGGGGYGSAEIQSNP